MHAKLAFRILQFTHHSAAGFRTIHSAFHILQFRILLGPFHNGIIEETKFMHIINNEHVTDVVQIYDFLYHIVFLYTFLLSIH